MRIVFAGPKRERGAERIPHRWTCGRAVLTYLPGAAQLRMDVHPVDRARQLTGKVKCYFTSPVRRLTRHLELLPGELHEVMKLTCARAQLTRPGKRASFFEKRNSKAKTRDEAQTVICSICGGAHTNLVQRVAAPPSLHRSSPGPCTSSPLTAWNEFLLGSHRPHYL